MTLEELNLEQPATETLLGKGRSAFVLKRRDDHTDTFNAVKIFSGNKPTKFWNFIFLGVPSNPYVYDEEAVRTAHYKREVLSPLIKYWFGEQLRIAESLGVEWNAEFKAYSLITEFVKGRYPKLPTPYSRDGDGELSDLVNNIQKPLQKHLLEAGFDGSVWQAGY